MALLIKSQRYIVVCEARLIGSPSTSPNTGSLPSLSQIGECTSHWRTWYLPLSELSSAYFKLPTRILRTRLGISFSKCVHFFYSDLDIIFYDGEYRSSSHLCKLYHLLSFVLAAVFCCFFYCLQMSFCWKSTVRDWWNIGLRPWHEVVLLKHLTKTADGWPVRVWDSVLTSGWGNIQTDQW